MRLLPIAAILLLFTACASKTQSTRMQTDADPNVMREGRKEPVALPEEPLPEGARGMELDARPASTIDPYSQQIPQPMPEEPKPPV
jgi:hypothetical protein